MKTVYPNAFVFRQEKGLPISNSTSNCYQLTIEANFKESLTSNSSKLSPNVLITRKLRFEKYLLEIVKELHQKFLRKLNMNILDSELHRWHPHFKVNDVPDIDLSSLPQPPIIKGFSTAADMIMRNKGGLAPKLQNALSIAADKTAQVEANTKANSESNKNDDTKDSNSLVESSGINAPTSSILKGVSQSILQRIRQKEQKRMHLAMTRDPKKEQRLSNMARLPEICRILKSYFTAEKKVAIGLEDCVQKLTESYGSSLHSAKLEEHVKLLGDLVPEWLKIVMVRKYPFVKLVKGYDINKVLSLLEDLRAKELAT